MKEIQQWKKELKYIKCISSCALLFALMMIVVQICEIHFPKSFHIFLNTYADSASINSVSMTLGLTGVLFSWLLQIIQDQECSQPMSTLYEYILPQYVLQILVFIIAIILCIGFSGSKADNPLNLLIAIISFIAALAGLINMWFLCWIFLFSRDRRRLVAFSYMSEKLEKKTDKVDFMEIVTCLEQWGEEIPRCLGSNEEEQARNFFSSMWKNRPANNAPLEMEYDRACHQIMRTLVRSSSEHKRGKVPLHMLMAEQDAQARVYFLCLYTISLLECFPEEYMEHSPWANNRYTYVWHYLMEPSLNAVKSKEKRCSFETERYYVYCAIVAVLYSIERDNNASAIKCLKGAYGSVNSLKPEEAEHYYVDIWRIICSISGFDGDEQTEIMLGKYYHVLVHNMVKPINT